MFELIKTGTKFDFIGKSRIYFTVSLVLCFLGLVLIFAKGFNYGVDFSGGTSGQVTLEKPVDRDKMRTTLSQDVGASVSIQTLGSDNSFRIKVDQGSGDENLKKISDTISNTLKAKFSEGGNVTIDSVEQVGPQVGKDLKRQAFLAVLYAVIGILIYVAIRFELMSATSSIIALIHDIILTLGVVIALNVTFDLTVLAALLTVVGYSLNDKIVIFDRIRERARMDEHIPLMESMNISINETLSRTILTSTSTLLAVISLAIFGGEVIKGFAIVMIAGIIIGTYSSIGIASSLVYAIKTRKGKK